MRPAVFAFSFACLVFVHVPANAQTVTPIADIQANPAGFDGTVVTVEAQVFVPTDYRGTLYSGYVQDGSGRGISLFGSTANNPLLFDVGNIVRVTGTVDIYFTTVEIVDLTSVTLLSIGNPPLEPVVLSTGAAASSAWEGTFIESSGPIIAREVGGPGTNYTIDDGSGPLVIRVVDALSAPQFSIGQTIRGRGAGSQFQSTYQILVGRVEDVFGQAQVCTGDVLLTSQAQVDAFNCSEVTGDLIIDGPDITNLDALSSLTSVGADMLIFDNPTLNNLDGLSSLTSVGSLDISYNGALIDINGLSSLTTVEAVLSLTDCDALTNIDSLSSLTLVGELAIWNNPALTIIDGLSSLASVGSLIIGRNDALTDIDGLSSLTSVGSLDISDNGALININGLSSLTSVEALLLLKDCDALTNIDGLSSLTLVDTVWSLKKTRR